MEYEIGDLVTYRLWGGQSRTVRVEEKDDDIKNGRPGFCGEIVAGEESISGGGWGYDNQIIRVQKGN